VNSNTIEMVKEQVQNRLLKLSMLYIGAPNNEDTRQSMQSAAALQLANLQSEGKILDYHFVTHNDGKLTVHFTETGHLSFHKMEFPTTLSAEDSEALMKRLPSMFDYV
jgi:hypothetical protein